MRLSRCTSTATCTAFGSLRCRRPCVSRMTRPSRFAGRAFSFALRSARVLPLRMFHVSVCAEWAFRHSFGRVWRFARAKAALFAPVRRSRRACRPGGCPHPSRPRAMAQASDGSSDPAKSINSVPDGAAGSSTALLYHSVRWASLLSPPRAGVSSGRSISSNSMLFRHQGASGRLQAAWEVVRQGVRSQGETFLGEVMRRACALDVCSGKEEHACRRHQVSESPFVSERQRASKPPSDPRALREILRLACARPGWRTETPRLCADSSDWGGATGARGGISRYDGSHGTGAIEEEHGKTHEDRLHAGICVDSRDRPARAAVRRHGRGAF